MLSGSTQTPAGVARGAASMGTREDTNGRANLTACALSTLAQSRARRGSFAERAPSVLAPADELVGLGGADPADRFSLPALVAGGVSVVPWTVNDPARMSALARAGAHGLITDRPDLLDSALPPLGGRPFDAQGHRGARGLRPENTLPALEAALDARVTTLEVDVALTADGVPILAHDPELSRTCRANEAAKADRVVALTLSEVRRGFVCDRLTMPPPQTNELGESPVATAFARARGLPHAYTPPTLDDALAFVKAYGVQSAAELPSVGRCPGCASAAAGVGFSIELKVSAETFARGETAAPAAFVERVVEVVKRHGVEERVAVQSFDADVLRAVETAHPELRTVYLVGRERGALSCDPAPKQ